MTEPTRGQLRFERGSRALTRAMVHMRRGLRHGSTLKGAMGAQTALQSMYCQTLALADEIAGALNLPPPKGFYRLGGTSDTPKRIR